MAEEQEGKHVCYYCFTHESEGKDKFIEEDIGKNGENIKFFCLNCHNHLF